jgi:hypothetical protein
MKARDTHARFPWRRYLALAATIALLTLAPVLSVLAAYAIASVNDCTLHEGFVNPCLIAGVDLGSGLYTMGVLGWLGLITLPIGIPALVVLALVGTVHFVLHKRKYRR